MKKSLTASVLVGMLIFVFSLAAQAAVVGRFVMVKGQVDLLKQGKIPGIPAKLNDGVEPGDTIRTKSASKAELQMVDESIITMAPETRLAVADYSFEPASGQRHAVLRFFSGLVHTVVNKVVKTEEPDFIMETHTAVIGVRGTDWYTVLVPNFTAAYLLRGVLDVRSNLPTIPAILSLQAMQFTHVARGAQPQLPQPLTPDTVRLLEKMMDTGVRDFMAMSGSGPIPVPGGQFPFTLPGSSPPVGFQPIIPPKLPAPTLTQPAPTTPSQSGPNPPTGFSTVP